MRPRRRPGWGGGRSFGQRIRMQLLPSRPSFINLIEDYHIVRAVWIYDANGISPYAADGHSFLLAALANRNYNEGAGDDDGQQISVHPFSGRTGVISRAGILLAGQRSGKANLRGDFRSIVYRIPGTMASSDLKGQLYP